MALTVASSLSVEAVDWSQLDTILLDMDGTLLDLEFDNHFWGTVIPGEWGRQRGLDVKTSQETLAPVFAYFVQSILLPSAGDEKCTNACRTFLALSDVLGCISHANRGI